MYDLSPMMVQITEHRRSFLHFLTGVCAIVGGVFTGKVLQWESDVIIIVIDDICSGRNDRCICISLGKSIKEEDRIRETFLNHIIV